METIDAVYEKGVFRPTEKVKINEGERVRITVEITKVEKNQRKKDPAEAILDLSVDTGIPDLAINIDHYLYGLPKQSE